MEFIGYILLFIAFVLIAYIIFAYFKIKTLEDEPKDWKNLPPSLRVYLWIGKNYKVFLITSFLLPVIALSLIFFVYSLKEKEKLYLSKSIENLSNKVLLLYPNGQVAYLYLSNLKPEAVKSFLDDVAINYLVWGKICLFKNGNFPLSWQGIPKYCPKVSFFLKSNLLSNAGKYTYFQALKGIFALAKADELPEVIKPERISSDIKIFKKNGVLFFLYNASVKTYLEYVKLGETQKYYGEGIYKIEMSGIVDPEKGNMSNPFGVKINSISLTPPVKS